MVGWGAIPAPLKRYDKKEPSHINTKIPVE